MGSRALTPPSGIPIPEAPEVRPEPALLPPPQQEQPRALGMPSKAAQGAKIADDILRGWMAGKYHREQKMQQQAREQVANARTGVDIAGQAYQALRNQGLDEKDPKVADARKALTAAWQNYLGLASKYVAPPEGQKKGVGKRIKEAMTPQNPRMFLDASLKALQGVDPSSLYGEDIVHRQQREIGDVKLQEAKQEQQYEKDLQVPKEKRTPEMNARIEGWERIKFGEKPAKQQAEDALISDVLNGKSKSWTPEQKQLAEAVGVIRHNTVTPNFREVASPGGKKQTQVVLFDSDGKMVGHPYMLPGNAYVPPDHWESARHAMDGEIAARTKWYEKTGMSHQSAVNAAMQDTAKHPINFQAADQEGIAVSRALNQVLGQVKKENPDLYSKMANFVSTTPNGLLVLDSQMMAPTGQTDPGFLARWFKGAKPEATFAGGARAEELPGIERELKRRLRVAYEKSGGRKRTPEEIDQMLGPMLSDSLVHRDLVPPQDRSNLQPPPGQQAQQKPVLYSIKLGGSTYQRKMTPDQAAALQHAAEGSGQKLEVTLIGGSSEDEIPQPD